MEEARDVYPYLYEYDQSINGTSHYEYDLSNVSYSYDEVHLEDSDKGVEISLQIVLAFLITVVNGLVMTVIISDKTLRTSPKYIHVLNLTLADLIYSLTVLPFLAEYSLRGKWVHACELRLYVDLYDISFHPAFTWLTLSMLNIVILFTVCTTLFDKRAPRPYIAVALMVIPWLMTSLAFVPLFRSVIEPLNMRGVPCMYTISAQRNVALLLLTYPLMCLFLVLTSFLTIVLVIYRRNVSIRCGNFPSRGDDCVPRGDPEDERREYMCDVLLACILTVLLSFPVFALQMYFKIKNGDDNCVGVKECNIYILGSHIVYFIRVSRSAIVPTVWFLGKDFRYAFVELMKREKIKEPDE